MKGSRPVVLDVEPAGPLHDRIEAAVVEGCQNVLIGYLLFRARCESADVAACPGSGTAAGAERKSRPTADARFGLRRGTRFRPSRGTTPRAQLRLVP